MAAPGYSPRTGGGAKRSAMAPPAMTQDKVVVGHGAHGVEYVGFVRNLELWGKEGEHQLKV